MITPKGLQPNLLVATDYHFRHQVGKRSQPFNVEIISPGPRIRTEIM